MAWNNQAEILISAAHKSVPGLLVMGETHVEYFLYINQLKEVYCLKRTKNKNKTNKSPAFGPMNILPKQYGSDVDRWDTKTDRLALEGEGQSLPQTVGDKIFFVAWAISKCLSTTPHPTKGKGVVYFLYINL